MSDNYDDVAESIDTPDFRLPFARRGGPRWGNRSRRPLGRTTPWWVEQTPETEPDKYPTTDVRISFTYDLFGDIELTDWEQRFYNAQKKSWIEDHNILLVQTGIFGLRHLIMLVDAKVPAGEKERVQQEAFHLLSIIIGERDLQLLQVTPL